MGHIKDILIECDNDPEIARKALEIMRAMDNKETRLGLAICMAKLFNLITEDKLL